MFNFESILSATESRFSAPAAPVVVSVNNDISSINFVAGMSDPGEMIGCGMYQNLRRLAGESDSVYADRLRVELATLPTAHREKIESVLRDAAIRRAGLDTTGGKISVMTVAGADGRNSAWHGLGTVVSSAVTARDAIVLAGLNWKVGKHVVSYRNPVSGELEVIPNQFAVVREDTGANLGLVGRVYTPFQNEDGFDFLDSVVGEFGAHYHTAGAIFGGSRVWMQLQIPGKSFSVNGVDTVEPFVSFFNSHDGTTAAQCFTTTERIVCRNTLRLAQNRADKFHIRHASNLKTKVAAARESLGMAIEKIDSFREDAETMARTNLAPRPYFESVLDAVLDVSASDAERGARYLAALLADNNPNVNAEKEEKRIQKQIDNRFELMGEILANYDSPTNRVGGMAGTAWAAFNAVTESADHGKMGGRTQGADKNSRRFESIVNGPADAVKQIAFETVRRTISA